MPTLFWTILWGVLATAGCYLSLSAPNALVPDENWRYVIAAVMAIITLMGILPNATSRRITAAPLRWLRRRPLLYWFLLLVVICVMIGLWLVPYQPTYGRPLTTIEFAYVCFMLWAVIYLLVFDMTAEHARPIAERLGKSKLTGILITLTTLVVLFFTGEAYLRVFDITTDGYGFTAMNYWWYRNFYWGHYNSLGYRDHEPKPDPDGSLIKVAVVGDSFAVGHGIDDMDQSFPQMLERELGDQYDVLLVADSGWDSDVELSHLDQFPIEPNIVVLSYYLNDIDYLMQSPELNPDRNFTFIQNPQAEWFVLNFFVPNYIYYVVLQYTSPARTHNFINDLISAHLNDDLWSQQVNNLQAMVDWTQARGIRFIVLIWPHLLAVEDSRPATARVRDFFQSHGVEVVDMTDVLAGKDSASLVVNRFDAHPGIPAQQLAADALYAEITRQAGS